MMTTTTTTMRAITQRGYGGPETFQLSELPVPTIGDNQVLIKVHAAGMDRGTWHLMHGSPLLMRPALGFRGLRQPIPGRDVAGVVTAIGAKVSRFAVGDRVFGIAPGSFAEYAVAVESKLAAMPAELDFPAAAVLGISGLTALAAVRDKGAVGPGQRVLITGASGGVGSYAVQLAAAAGADVTAVCSAAKADFVASLGATRVLDYAREDVTATDAPYDVIIDIAGMTPVAALREVLTPTGRLVMVGGEGDGKVLNGMGRQFRAAAKSAFVRQQLILLLPKEEHVGLETLAAMVAAGTLIPALDRVFPLAEAADAMAYLESGAVRGKLALAPITASV